jgi:hypothetical protein
MLAFDLLLGDAMRLVEIECWVERLPRGGTGMRLQDDAAAAAFNDGFAYGGSSCWHYC